MEGGRDGGREGGTEGGAQAMTGNQLVEYMIQLTRHIVLINLLYS